MSWSICRPPSVCRLLRSPAAAEQRTAVDPPQPPPPIVAPTANRITIRIQNSKHAHEAPVAVLRNFDDTKTVTQLKQALEEETGVPPAMMSLFKDGTWLTAEKTLQECGVKDGARRFV